MIESDTAYPQSYNATTHQSQVERLQVSEEKLEVERPCSQDENVCMLHVVEPREMRRISLSKAYDRWILFCPKTASAETHDSVDRYLSHQHPPSFPHFHPSNSFSNSYETVEVSVRDVFCDH